MPQSAISLSRNPQFKSCRQALETQDRSDEVVYIKVIVLRNFLPCAIYGNGPEPKSCQPAANQQLLKSEELDALVAPIALYPDTLLAEVLMASTYPLEVVQADRWATENKNLKGRSN